MRLFKRSGLERARLVAAAMDNFGYSFLHRLNLLFKPRRIEQGKVDLLSERVHIDLKAADTLYVESQKQVIVALSTRGVIGIVFVIIYPKLAKRSCIIDLKRENVMRKRREHSRSIQKTLEQICGVKAVK